MVKQNMASSQSHTQLGTEGFATASNGGLWSMLRTEQGPRIVDEMLERLDKQGFATASSGGLWSILRTEEGPRIVDEMLERLDKQVFATGV
jgi:hypothetical protein